MARENPYESPKTTQECGPFIALSVTIFMGGAPLVIFGVQGVAAVLYWLVLGEYDSGPVLLLVGIGASCSLVAGLAIWRVADRINPRKSRMKKRRASEAAIRLT